MPASSAASDSDHSTEPSGYVPIVLRSDWILERYYGWSVVHRDERSKLLRRRVGPTVRHLIVAKGLPPDSLDDLARRWRVFHPFGITSFNDFSAAADEPRRNVAGRLMRRVAGPRWFGVGTFLHDLGTEERALWSRMAPRERTKCRSAARQGVRVEVTDRPSERDLEGFLQVYTPLATERGIGLPRLETLIAMSRSTRLTLARCVGADDRTLVANLVYRLHDHGYFLFGARAAEIPPGAGHLIHWEMMRKLKRDGCRFYDLGLVASRNPRDGIYRFKRSLGGNFVSSGAEFEWVSPLVALPLRLLARHRTGTHVIG